MARPRSTSSVSRAAPAAARPRIRLPRGPWGARAALALALAVPVAVEGGFTTTSRQLFAGLALVALALVTARDERPLVGLVRAPSILLLVALAALASASAAWTIGDPADALRSGLVIGALAALALVAGWVTRVHGVGPVVAVIVALAAVEAVLGLASVAMREEPWAQRLGGSWRPGGTLEYPPALVLLQLSALPARGWAMLRTSRYAAAAGAAGAAAAGAVIVLAGGRAGLALAAGLAVAAVAGAPWLGVRRWVAAAAAAVPTAAGIAAFLAIGGYVPPAETGGAAGRLLALAAIVAAAAAIWTGLQARLFSRAAGSAGGERSLGRPAVSALAAVALCLAAGAIAAFSDGGEGAGVEPVSGFDHGRAAEWSAAAEVALERPLAGSGPGTYPLAMAESGEEASLYAHSLPVEAWVELGPLGLALVLGLYAAAGALAWRVRREPRAWLLAPAVLVFLAANLVDWPWHLAGSAAVWAAALGALAALNAEPRNPAEPTAPRAETQISTT